MTCQIHHAQYVSFFYRRAQKRNHAELCTDYRHMSYGARSACHRLNPTTRVMVALTLNMCVRVIYTVHGNNLTVTNTFRHTSAWYRQAIANNIKLTLVKTGS